MTDLPSIFSPPMVRALLARDKTQTRRLVTSPLRKCEIGDRLYVREHWSSHPAFDGVAPRDLKNGSMIYTRADSVWHNAGDWVGAPFGKHRQGMHMPRWASRLTLFVEGVKVEPLGYMPEADAIAEGVFCERKAGWSATGDTWWASPKIAFHHLWDQLHTKEGERWQDNPDVVALTFRVVRGNIDQVTS